MTTIFYTGKTLPKTAAAHIRLVHCPTITTRLRADLRAQCIRFDIDHAQTLGVVVYSSTGVFAITQIADLLNIEQCVFWCVGKKTQTRLRSHFPEAQIHTPETQNFAGLVDCLQQQDTPPILLSIELVDTPRALAKHLVHPNILTIEAYESLKCHHKQINAFHHSGNIDWVVITSPKGAAGFFESLCKTRGQNFKIASIGPTTTAAIEALGYAVDYQPVHPNTESIIQHIAQVSTTV